MAGATRRIIYTRLEGGTRICIRPIDGGDEARMRDGIARMTPHSRYLRFFTGMPVPPDRVIASLTSPDGYRHIAWGALDMDAPGQPAIGAVHAYRDAEAPECAEFSVGVVNAYHGRGLAKLLTTTVLLDAMEQGLLEFQAIVLAENANAIGFVRALGGKLVERAGAQDEYHLPISPAIAILRAACEPPGIAEVFAAFASGAAGEPES